MKNWILTFLLLIIPLSAEAAEKFIYQSYDKNNELLDHWFSLEFIERNAQGWRMRSHRKIDGLDIYEEYQLDENYATLWWNVDCKEHGTSYKGRRVGNKLIMQGRLNGKELTREIKIDDKPFYYNPKVGLIPFAKSDETKHEFWGIHNLVLARYNLIAKKIGKQKLLIDGVEEEVVGIEWKARRVPALIFNRTYWFRTSDYMYVRQDEKRGVRRELVGVE